MKVKAYVRVGRDRDGQGKVSVTTKPSHEPISTYSGRSMPTVAFAVEFEIPDEKFSEAEKVLASITVEQPEIAASVKQVSMA